ncbi:integrase [Sagittula marina]|uniref:Integrase n=1 Tax=Sagittula marina TaxID=943940 RepID=A0A7W6GSR5_9RHOB|nr:integrase [Sagittula marina]MBB3984379.1 integrase [Sagittula marina]
MIREWDAMLNGASSVPEERWHAARDLAEAKGFKFIEANELLQGPVEDIVTRVEAVGAGSRKARLQAASALLGTTPPPKITVTRALDLYWELTETDQRGKSDDQIRRMRNPVIKAFKNFVDVVGDKAVSGISRDDMLDFRAWWADRINESSCKASTANKDLTHFSKVLKRVNDLKRLGYDLPVSGLSFKEGRKEPRCPFSTNWIRDRLLEPDALKGLNTQARCILLGMINTGYRPIEGAALLPQRIKLEGAVPMIEIRPDEREVKTDRAIRDIPLAGVSLEAFREYRDGFPRYRDKPGLSATINKFLRGNGLMETPKHSMYGLRHAFEDRLLEAGVDERIRRDFMGHQLSREQYGNGASPRRALECISLIAL